MAPKEESFYLRELSWLDFNERVLELSEDETIPLLERVRFLAIFSSNLDEFFMVRVATLKQKIELGNAGSHPNSKSSSDLLNQILTRTRELVIRQTDTFKSTIVPLLKDAGIEFVKFHQLSDDEKKFLNHYYQDRVHPVLTPLIVDSTHPFPRISGLSLNIGVDIHSAEHPGISFARIKIPTNLPRYIRTSADYPLRFVLLEEIIAENLKELYPGVDLRDHFFFRVTRNEDFDLEDDDGEGEDFLVLLEEELLKRKFGPLVRLEVDKIISERVLNNLMENLEITPRDVVKQDSPLDLTCLNFIADLPLPKLKYKPFTGRTPSELQEVDSTSPDAFFNAIAQGEILLHHPYQSFSATVVKFLETAAKDPRVLTIKQTLYRTSGDSPIVQALIEAAKAGKQVLVVVEVRARFDELANMRWAKLMEEVGIHVVYGVMGLKTHAKLSLVVREESTGLKRYCHVGTGNYNPKTARLYEDLGLLSANQALGEDLTRLFNELSGLAKESEYSRMLVAPRGLRTGITSRINREIQNHADGKTAWIRIKLNSLLDEKIISQLYRAAESGVKIELLVRGMCALELSTPLRVENIKIRSIVGRFLEHSRIYYFHNDGDEEYWIGSSDLMERNLDRRVEALVRVDAAKHKDELKSVLDEAMSDTYVSWELKANNEWTKHANDLMKKPLGDFHKHNLEKERVR